MVGVRTHRHAAPSVEEVFGSFASPGISASSEAEAGTLNGEQLTQVYYYIGELWQLSCVS